MTEPPTPFEGRPADPHRVLRLRALRAALGLTQEEVAERAALSRVQVNKIENGWDMASKLATFAALARGLGLTVDELDAVLGEEMTVEAAIKAVAERAGAAPR